MTAVTKYKFRAVIVVPVGNARAVVAQLAERYDPAGAVSMFQNSGLSATGKKPATHVWSGMPMRERDLQDVVALADTFPLMEIVISAPEKYRGTTARLNTHFDKSDYKSTDVRRRRKARVLVTASENLQPERILSYLRLKMVE